MQVIDFMRVVSDLLEEIKPRNASWEMLVRKRKGEKAGEFV